METPRLMIVTLADRETRQILVDAGSTLLVADGRLHLRPPVVWLAETMRRPDQRLDAEQTWVAESAGWIDLRADGGAQVLIVAPGCQPLWRKIGRCLADWSAGWHSTRRPLAGSGRSSAGYSPPDSPWHKA